MAESVRQSAPALIHNCDTGRTGIRYHSRCELRSLLVTALRDSAIGRRESMKRGGRTDRTVVCTYPVRPDPPESPRVARYFQLSDSRKGHI
jgi:hypothetical protein